MARRRKESEGGGYIGRLPEECILHVLSFTTPRDLCRLALVSTAFRSAASSDSLWEMFLPSDYQSILSRAVDPIWYSSKRELYLRLCDSILVDGGRMSFQLERSTGGKCYMISARSMYVTWGDVPRYWRWISLPESRFAEVAELIDVCWFDIGGRIDCQLLSPSTTYAAYLLYKLAPGSYGLDHPPQLASVRRGAYASEINVCLHQQQQHLRTDGWMEIDDVCLPQQQECLRNDGWMEVDVCLQQQQQQRLRNDGWMEIELGEFYNDKGDDGDVEMSLKQIEALHWKRGLIIQGLELRPKI